MRGREEEFGLDVNGFAWKKFPVRGENLTKSNQENDAAFYLKEVEEMVMETLGEDVRSIHVFDWKVCLIRRNQAFSFEQGVTNHLR